ncbi:MAG: TIGR04190 family B12-binding domain/radical SAM domain protein, partial [Chloroflexi bacterium]|nr:TIGR04190 family B12-binding domain/radical SAM domain protein [Chloroflexota bacterium]
MSRAELVLLHAPSNYDFRTRSILYGPISDVIPSTPVFEMYPIGFISIAAYLERNGVPARIVNIANRMLNEPRFDVERFLAKISPLAFGIDLHWLPHAQG